MGREGDGGDVRVVVLAGVGIGEPPRHAMPPTLLVILSLESLPAVMEMVKLCR